MKPERGNRVGACLGVWEAGVEMVSSVGLLVNLRCLSVSHVSRSSHHLIGFSTCLDIKDQIAQYLFHSSSRCFLIMQRLDRKRI